MYITRPATSTAPEDIIGLLVHEAVHVIQYYITDGDMIHLPVWLIEGTAMYFDGTLDSNYVRVIMSTEVLRNNISTLATVEGTDWESDWRESFIWASSIISFVHSTFGLEYVVELHRNYNIEEVFGISRAEFERQWHQYLRDNLGNIDALLHILFDMEPELEDFYNMYGRDAILKLIENIWDH